MPKHDDIMDFGSGLPINRKRWLAGGIATLVVLIAVGILVAVLVLTAPFKLPSSAPGQLLHLVRTDAQRPNGENPIVARSYDGNPWETVADQDLAPVEIGCGGTCITSKGRYTVKVIPMPEELESVSDKERFARFLSQTTFGFTMRELEKVVSTYPNNNYLQWLKDQMNVPPTYLRTYYRQRTNPRYLASTQLGNIFQPCELGSRWHNYAFNIQDEGNVLTVASNEVANAFTLRINGVLRGEVSALNVNITWPGTGSPYTFPMNFSICRVREGAGNEVKITTFANLTACGISIPNPVIRLTTPTPGTSVSLTSATASFTDITGRLGVKILRTLSASCALGVRDAFFQYNGEFYRFDPRLKLVDNTFENPVDSTAANTLKCPAVEKTFLNEKSCLRRPSCSPLSFSSTPVTLDDTTIKAWYTLSNRYVYVLRGLRLEDPFLRDTPCKGKSRWVRLGSGACQTTALDAETRATISGKLANSTDSNPYVVDIELFGDNCTATGTIGATVSAGGNCYKHVHSDEYSVRDFTYWSIYHDGNAVFLSQNKPNPIKRFAQAGLSTINFPPSHVMQRWEDKDEFIPAIGRYGDRIDFRLLTTELQTPEIANLVGAIRTQSDEGFEVCGSPAETKNEPSLGHRYQMPDQGSYETRQRELDYSYPFGEGKSMLWENVVLTASDQLRHRAAWVLAQIITLSAVGIEKDNENEPFAAFYDIFVRNAFGNYRDILREVSFSPMMSYYLSYYQNRAFAYANTYPDENYAREIMQLFSIGLWKLNEDGTQAMDANGNPLQTYTNDDIVDFARVWTGFDGQQSRSNIEEPNGPTSSNAVDPLQIKPGWRDFFPKAKLDSGYLGDRYPLCDSLPPQHFLKEGATWEYTGNSSIEGKNLDAEDPRGAGRWGRFTPNPATSQLYQKLCAPNSAGGCTFPSKVVLNSAIPCDGVECKVGRVYTAKIVDSVNKLAHFYTYTSVPCVRLTFFDSGKVTTVGWVLQCANPAETVAQPICCRDGNPTFGVTDYTGQCNYANEATNFAVAKARCEAGNHSMCNASFNWGTGWSMTCAENQFTWVDTDCNVQIQVYLTGQIGIVDKLVAEHSGFKVVRPSSGNVFRVRWENGAFPQAKNGCGAGCTLTTTLSGDSCMCDMRVNFRSVYDGTTLPSVQALMDTLFIGSATPSSFGNGVYTKCTSGPCASRNDVTVWVKSGSDSWDDTTIFELPPTRAGGAKYFVRNMESTVSIGSQFSFRNPPHFMPLLGEQTFPWLQWASDVLYLPRAVHETEALLDHLFEHQSTAPFVAYRYIQHLVTSNPSPRYVKSVVNAFKTGTYAGQKFSGNYGDLAATLVAVLLDPEARSVTLEADPTYGMLREPILKIMQVLRALEFQSNGSAEVVMPDLMTKIGMQPFQSKSVFGFFLPENRPAGPVSDMGLVSPQAQLGVPPLVVGYLNGISGLIDYGMTYCENGFGHYNEIGCWPNVSAPSTGFLTYRPSASDPKGVIDELDLLLTNRRLSTSTKEYILEQYTEVASGTKSKNPATDALRLAEKLILSAPEFHTTNANTPKNQSRVDPTPTPSRGRPYKAIVIMFQNGGCDSYNMIVPHSGCSNDLYQEYANIRGLAAIDKSNLFPFSVPAGTQPCTTFGLTNSMPYLKNLYDAKDALFVANIGALVEPITKDDFLGTSGKIKEYPPSLFAHNIMQRSMHNLDPQNGAAKGILGKTLSALEKVGQYKSELYSLIGTVKMLEGFREPDYVDPWAGVATFKQNDQLFDKLGNLTESEFESAFGETYARLLRNSLQRTSAIAGLLDTTFLNTTFGDDYVSRQFQQVSKLVKMRTALQTERAVFVVQNYGYDTHGTFDLKNLFGDIDKGMSSFVEEMKIQGVWDDVAIMTVSEFGRTLTTNGAGTDHAWGGNIFLAGGKVQGGQILGQYPTSLTDDGPVSLGRGRLVPTTSWEAVWKGLVQWFGVPDSELASILPNLGNFPASELFDKDKLFSN